MKLKDLWLPAQPELQIDVLVAESNPNVTRAAEMCCSTDRFRVKSVSTLASLQRELALALRGEGKIDLLILDPVLSNGSAEPALRQWSQWYSNPLIIICSDRLTVRQRDELILQGAWFILDDPMSYAVLGRQVRRFGRVILHEKRTAHLEKEVMLLRRYILVLLILTAVALGEGFIPYLVSWASSLLTLFGG